MISCLNRELGINTLSLCDNEKEELFKLAQVMFDTKLPPGVKMLQPYAEDATLKKVAVQVCDSVCLLELIIFIEGISV